VAHPRVSTVVNVFQQHQPAHLAQEYLSLRLWWLQAIGKIRNFFVTVLNRRLDQGVRGVDGVKQSKVDILGWVKAKYANIMENVRTDHRDPFAGVQEGILEPLVNWISMNVSVVMLAELAQLVSTLKVASVVYAQRMRLVVGVIDCWPHHPLSSVIIKSSSLSF